MSLSSNIVLRGSTFYFRCRVPADLISPVGRRELGRSLRTADRGLARSRSAALHAAAQRLWAELRFAMTREEIDRLVQRWLAEELANDAAARVELSFADVWTQPGHDVSATAAAMLLGEAEDSLFQWKDILAKNNWQEAEPIVNVLLKEHGLELAKDTQPYRLLCMAIGRVPRNPNRAVARALERQARDVSTIRRAVRPR